MKDYVDLYEKANEMRTHEIQRINSQLLHESGIALKWLGHKSLVVLHGISELVRPLFSWNPQTPHSHSH